MAKFCSTPSAVQTDQAPETARIPPIIPTSPFGTTSTFLARSSIRKVNWYSGLSPINSRTSPAIIFNLHWNFPFLTRTSRLEQSGNHDLSGNQKYLSQRRKERKELLSGFYGLPLRARRLCLNKTIFRFAFPDWHKQITRIGYRKPSNQVMRCKNCAHMINFMILLRYHMVIKKTSTADN